MITEKQILDRIYPSVTTWDVDWRKMVSEVKRYKLKEISLFVTGVNFTECQRLYRALESTSVRKIPHVHMRHDMRESELDYLTEKFNSRAFTLHYQYFRLWKNSKYAEKIFIETNRKKSAIKGFAVFKQAGGLCVDLSHITRYRKISPKNYLIADKAAAIARVGCNHISAVTAGDLTPHYVNQLSELDYLTKLPRKFFSPLLCIELMNPIKDQLRFKKYIARILAKAWK